MLAVVLFIYTVVFAVRSYRSGHRVAGILVALFGLLLSSIIPLGLRGSLPGWLYNIIELACFVLVSYWTFRYIGEPIAARIKGGKGGSWLSCFSISRIGGRRTTNRYEESRSSYGAERARYSFKDVAGMVDLKKKLSSAVAAIKGDGKNGILLTGDPGNGKTFMAEALAGELKLPFMSITYGDVASKWINQTTEQVMAVFDSARRAAPCVLFLDEVDSLIKDRSALDHGGSSAVETAKTTNAILTELVNLRGSGVIIVAASNFPDQLDRAATREGRFDFKIEVPPPDYEARAGLLDAYLARSAGESRSSGLFGWASRKDRPEVSLSYLPGVRERIARRWEGFSNVRIRTVIEHCAKKVKEKGEREISFEAMMESLREVQGTAGEKLSENTKTIAELSFDKEDKDRLLSLAKRMTNIDEIEAMGGTVPKGVLFYGPPGTGKTATAKGLAKSSGWAFLPTTGQELFSHPDKVTEILKKAADIRPCIVFIDEADDILQDRASNPHSKASTNKLLAAMEGNLALPDVMFVAATNHPDMLDTAALRGGRFSEHFLFSAPDEVTMRELVSDWMKSKSSTPFASDFTPEAVARLLNGLPPSDARDGMQKAINLALARMDGTSFVLVGLSDLEAAISR